MDSLFRSESPMPDPIPRQPCLEICVDTAEGLATALAAGADRIELCADLGVGGLTPSPGLIAMARSASVPVYAMIRPRQGDFVYGARDLQVMLEDIAAARQAGLAGVVLGASRPDRRLDTEMLHILCQAAAGLGTTLHRAFDLAPDRHAALASAIELGFERILTSGGVSDARGGCEALRDLVATAGNRIAIMVGGGVTPANVGDLLYWTGAREAHSSAKAEVAQDADLIRWGFASARTFATDRDTIRALRAAMARPSAAQTG